MTDEDMDEALAGALGAMADGVEQKCEERIRAAVLAEREACAKVAEKTAVRAQGTDARNDAHKSRLYGEVLAASEIAGAIRARK